MTKIIFSHGKESGPWGSKIKRLAQTAKTLGFEVDSIDYQGISSPEARVEKLLAYVANESEPYIYVGSSMGGYVSLVAAESSQPNGIFLLAPALYMNDYERQEYLAQNNNIEIVHGWLDDIVPVENSIRYAQPNNVNLHLINGDHRLNSSIEEVVTLFKAFLNRV